jgi:rfaE bifunctional protein kinase chain/domain
VLSTTLIEQILQALPRATIGLVGDLFLDRYLDIDASLNEPSIETGLPAYQVVRVRSYPGALGTVVNNLSALGVGRIVPISLIGDDGEGYELLQALRQRPGVVLDGIIRSGDRRTPTYCKPMLGELGQWRELNRLDTKNRTPTPGALEQKILERVQQLWSQCEVVLILDQVSEANCGVITDRVRMHLAEQAAISPRKLVLADSRARIPLFRGVSIKPNRMEVDAVGHPRWAEVEANPGILSESWGCQSVLMTDAANGIRVWDANAKAAAHVPAYPVRGPIDVCGAGDSCSAAIAAAVVGGANLFDAAAFGNLIASITIQQLGTTGTATPEQVRTRWREVNP